MDHSSSTKRNAARGKDLLGVQLEVTTRYGVRAMYMKPVGD